MSLILQQGSSADVTPPASLKEIGAQFAKSRGEVTPAVIDPKITREQAHQIALTYFLDGLDLPDGYGVEEKVTIKDTTALFSGTASNKGTVGEWEISNREVWVVVLHDIPVSLPCGGMGSESCEKDPPHLSLAIDASTGEVIRGQLLGAGPSTWSFEELAALRDVVGSEPSRVPPTPTPTPTQ